jgi:hypothetical protein
MTSPCRLAVWHEADHPDNPIGISSSKRFMPSDDKMSHRFWIAILVIAVFMMSALSERIQVGRFIIAPFFAVSSAVLSRAYMTGAISDNAVKAAAGLSFLALFLGDAVRRWFVDG